MNKSWITLFSGLMLLLVSCVLIFFSMNKHLNNEKLFYTIGKIADVKGDVKKENDGKKTNKIKFNDLIYSNDKYTLGSDSYIEIEIDGETLNIIGPAEFTFNVMDANSRLVFVNFSEFTELLPKDFESKKINLTYRGWLIQPFFDPQKDFESSQKQKLQGYKSDFKDEISEQQEGIEPQPIPEEDKSSYLEEIISIKRPLLKKCYENYLLDNPMATGELVVEFTLSSNGKVSSAKVKDSSFFRGESFKLCIVNVFKQIKSRPFSGEHIQVSYPIEFM